MQVVGRLKEEMTFLWPTKNTRQENTEEVIPLSVKADIEHIFVIPEVF